MATHIRITSGVAKEFGLDSRKLISACVYPDKVRVLKNHHSFRALLTAMSLLRRARRRYRNGENFLTHLGIAVHYLQDYSFNPTGRHFFFKVDYLLRHQIKEKMIEIHSVPGEAIEEGKKAGLSGLFFRFLLSGRKKRVDDAVYAATYMTTLAFRYVLE